MIGRFAANAAMVAIAALPAMQSAAQQSTRPAQWSLAKAPNCTSYSPCGTGTDPKATCLATLQAEVLAHACVVFTGLKNVSFGDSGHDVSCKADAQFVADGSCWWYSASFTDGLAERVFPYCEIQLTSTQTVQQALRLGDFNYVCTATAPPAPPPPVPPPPPPPPSPPPAPFPPEGCAAGEGGFFACVPATGLGGSAPPVTTPLQNGGAPPIDVPPALPPASPTPGEITMEGGDASWCAGPNAAGNPIFTGTGNKYEREVDLTGPGGLALVRHYNSGLKGWVHNWQMRLRFDGNSVVAVRPDGKVLVFTGAGIGPWGSNATVEERLTRLSSNVDGAPAWQLITTTDSVELYDAGGRMLSLTARGGRSFRFTYSGPLLQSVTDDFGRSLGFGYDASARLITAFAPGGETVLYGYGGNGHLAWVQHADGTSRRYLYENATFPYALTGLVDEAGRRFGSWSYDAMGRAVATEHAGGVQRYSIGYADDGLSALITEPLGAQRQVRHSSVSGRMIFTGANEPCAQCVGDASAAQPDTAGRIVQNDDFNGTPNQFTYELTRNLPVTVIRAAGRAEGKTMSIQWHPGWRLPVLVTETGKVTEYE